MPRQRRPFAALGTLTLVVTLVLLAAWPALAQPAKASLSGSVSSGLYTTHSRGAIDSSTTFVPLTWDLDLAGYLGAPGFLDFDVRPELTLGPQATEAGFTGGNGVALTINFLSHRDYPLQITYENLQREDVFLGSLSQLSGIRSLNHNRVFGLNWQWRRALWPQITFDMGNSLLTAEPILAVLSGFASRASHQTINLHDKHLGWTIEGILRRDTLASNLANPADSLKQSFQIDQTFTRYQATAARPLWSGSQLTLSGTVLHNHNVFDGHPFDQDTRSVWAGMNFGKGQKLQGGARVLYSSNLLGSAIQQALSGLATGQPGGVLLPDPLLPPVNVQLTNLSNTAYVRYRALADWSLLGSVRQDRVRAPAPLRTTPEADYVSGSAGVAFQHSYSWASVNGEYTRNLGRSTYAQQHGQFGGQNLSLSVHRGSVDDLQLGGSYNYSNQRFVQVQPLSSKSQSGEFTAGKRLRSMGLTLRGSLGLQDSSFHSSVSDYRARGISFRVMAEHRLAQANYSRNTGSGNTVQGLLSNPESNVLTTVLLAGTPLQVLLSSRVSDTLSVHSNPWRRLEINYLRIHGTEILGGVINRYAQSELRVGHRFRRLVLEMGYVSYEQSFVTLFTYSRNRFYIRVARSFEVF